MFGQQHFSSASAVCICSVQPEHSTGSPCPGCEIRVLEGLHNHLAVRYSVTVLFENSDFFEISLLKTWNSYTDLCVSGESFRRKLQF